MSNKIHPHLAKIMETYDLAMGRDLWDCKGKIVAYHHALERVAQQAKISFSAPDVLTDDFAGKGVAICVHGKLGEQSEWSIGEASQSNYRVVGKMQGYPWAMAEKRAKDRVILKLIGLHGIVYSEEESDSFKQDASEPQKQPQNQQSDQTIEGDNSRLAALEFHIDQTNTSIPDFCRYFGISKIPDMPVARFQEAIDMLNKKAGKAA